MRTGSLAEARAGMPSTPSRAAPPGQPSSSRRLSRGSAAATRRLDECVADELGRALAPLRSNLPLGGTMHDIDGTAAVSWGADRIDLFWVDTDGALVHRAFRAGDLGRA